MKKPKAINPYKVNIDDIYKPSYKYFGEEPKPIEIEIKPGEPVRLIPGSIYVVETDKYLSDKDRNRLKENLESQLRRYDIEFLILDGNLKLAKLEKDEHS